jgi:hypothetical protein
MFDGMELTMLNLPAYDCEITENEGKKFIFDTIRRKDIVLTPEEWVRQHFIHLLINELGFAKGLIKIESGMLYHQLNKRTDILVYDKAAKPYLLIECKAPKVPLNKKVISQATVYNKILKAPFIAITNGLKTFCFEVDFETGTSTQMKAFPERP